MKSIFLSALMASATIMGAAAANAEDNPWMVRGRILGVMPDESADLSVAGTALAGDADIEEQYVPELDITYFFNKNVAVELILAVTQHDVAAVDVTVPGALTDADVPLGDVWLLPPTLTLQYHFDNGTQFKPYVGAGINATMFFDENAGPVADSIDYDSSFGPALQVGFDYDLDGEPGGWAFNADVKKIWINTDVTVDFTTALGATVNAEVDIDPVVVGLGLGYKF
ncbi:MAG: OmpW family protein [Alphaproteobacteria bacterium]|nr:OmpW family protein [Alphaproteobacteria bacterium]